MSSVKKVVAYYRVSTKQQGKSGLGLDGQKAAVCDYVTRDGGTILAEYTEVETGKSKDRPELLKAVAHAKRAKAVLLVAKLDRLARNVAFTSALMESGVDFVACDNPHANKFTIHILAAVAEHEAEQISLRTKAALQAAKRRGVKLGSARPGHWDGREDKRQAGLVKACQAAGRSHNRATAPHPAISAPTTDAVWFIRGAPRRLPRETELVDGSTTVEIRGAAAVGIRGAIWNCWPHSGQATNWPSSEGTLVNA